MVPTVPRILLFGRIVLDHRFWVEEFPPRTSRTLCEEYLEDLGGPAAVASVTVAQLGGEAVFIGYRGDDPAGDRVETLLRSRGVDSRYLAVIPGARTPVAVVLIDPRGERFIFRHDGSPPPQSIEAVPLHELDRCDVVLVDSRWPKTAEALARGARARGLPVVLDFDVDTAETWAVAAVASHVIADEEMASRCGGVEVLLRQLAAFGAWGAVTLGSSGVAYMGGFLPAFRVRVRDTTGAGDVFHGAFALALAEHRAEVDALHFASAVAALRCHLGRVPDRLEVTRFLRARA